MNSTYKPFIFKLPSGSSSALKTDGSNKNNLVLSNIIAHPMCSLGFHYFLHRTKMLWK